MDGDFVPLWFKGQQFPDVLMKPAKRKALMRQNPICDTTNTTILATVATTIFEDLLQIGVVK